MFRSLWQTIMGRKQQCCQRVRRPAGRPRLCLEVLEGRSLPSVSVMPFTDISSGAAGLLVRTDGPSDTVTITDNSTDHTTTVVADGKTQTFDHQFTVFDLVLASHKDTLTFDAVGAFNQRLADLQVSLGTGENHFTFNPGLTAITNHSDVILDVLGHNGNDFVNLSFGDILESRVNVNEHGIGGSNSPLDPTAVRDTVTFGLARAGIRNSSVDVNVGLGAGNTNFQFTRRHCRVGR